MLDQFISYLPKNPLLTFTILLLVVLTIPPIFEKLKLPGLVGLLVAGIILGEDGLHFLDAESESMKLFSDIGKIYLMFVAGLEIDLMEFRNTKDRSLGFGFSTFIFPLIAGIIVGRIFDFSWNTSLLIGSLLASHTLLSYPIIQRLGVVKNEAVTVTIGATIFTDISALLVLAICVSIHQGEFSLASLITQLALLAIYAVVVLFGFDWAGKEYFRRTGDEEGNQFLFVLLAVFLASVGAQLINVDKIVGAFLAGLAVNDVVGRGPVQEKIEFVGGTLFIPFFFVGMGLLIDIPAFIDTVQSHFGLMVGIVGGLILSKFIAAIAVKIPYGYTFAETLTMWSLSIPQVAATLAAALAAYQALNSQGEPLISKAVFSSIIVLMLVTSILGPILTAQFARKLSIPQPTVLANEGEIYPLTLDEWLADEDSFANAKTFTVVVPIYNPHTQRYLIEMSALLARHESGVIVPLSIAKAHIHMDDPQLSGALRQSQRLMERSLEIAQEFQVNARPKIRIDDDIAAGISRTAREEHANLVIMGWSKTTGIRARLFGNVIDSVFWASHCPVAVMRLLDDPKHIHKLLIPVKIINAQMVKTIKFAQLFAESNQASVTLLHVCDRRTPPEQISHLKDQLRAVITQTGLAVKSKTKVIYHDDPAKVIVRASHAFDLVILRSMRRRTAGGLAVSDVTAEVLNKLTSSVILFGEPHS